VPSMIPGVLLGASADVAAHRSTRLADLNATGLRAYQGT